MDFIAVIFFIILYHLRPHEWLGPVASLRPAMITMLMALAGTLMRDRGFSIGLLLRTPLDRLMLIYLIWIVGSSPNPFHTWQSCYSLFLYYFIIVLALSNIERMRKFLTWWAVMLVCIAAFAVLSEYGFDPMHSQDLTQGMMKGRLVLNVSIFQNPNALGHSLVPGLGMLYFLFFWSRFFTVRLMVLPFFSLVAWCLYLTFSKGAYLSAFVTALVAYCFRRPLLVKIIVGLAAFTVGIAVLKSMPRMQELERPTAEGGIQGRVLVFRWGLRTLHETTAGVGWGNFESGFAHSSGFPKAPHSSYVCVGAELGWPGLAIFIGILYSCLKTLTRTVVRNEDEERIRRVLFVLFSSYCVSSWMVGWASRASFFIMVAVIGAYHREVMGMNDLPQEQHEKEKEVPVRSGRLSGRPEVLPLPQPPLTAMAAAGVNKPVPILVPRGGMLEPAKPEPEPAPVARNVSRLSRFGIMDYLLIALGTYAVIRVWSYAIASM